MYTNDGYMSAQLMRPERPAYDQPYTAGATTAQAAAAAAGYLSYSGPYDVDESTHVVHHHVAVSLLPNWLETVQLRARHARGEPVDPGGGAAIGGVDGAVHASVGARRAACHYGPATMRSTVGSHGGPRHPPTHGLKRSRRRMMRRGPGAPRRWRLRRHGCSTH
jgi:Lipocalin-like domain